MRVLHLNYDAREMGGASIAMIRIHRALRAHGVDSVIACLALPDEAGAVLLKRPLPFRVLQFICRCVAKILFGTCHSTGLVPSGIVPQVNTLKPDVVVLHWLQNDTCSVRELRKIRAPLVWMHHDLWPVKGIKAYDGLAYWCRWYWPWARLADALARRNKRRAYRALRGRLTPVAASGWVCAEIARSGAYGGREAVKIPLPMDDAFLAAAREAAKAPRGKTDRFTILNGARGGFCGGIKGGDRLLAALRLIPPDERAQMRLQILGGVETRVPDCGMEVEYLGWRPPEELPRAYAGADVFAFPSRQETFGQTKIEALACGTPVVCFDETACAEGVEHGKTGYVAKAGDLAGFADGIRFYYRQWRDGTLRRTPFAQDANTSPRVAEKWKEVFNAVQA